MQSYSLGYKTQLEQEIRDLQVDQQAAPTPEKTRSLNEKISLFQQVKANIRILETDPKSLFMTLKSQTSIYAYGPHYLSHHQNVDLQALITQIEEGDVAKALNIELDETLLWQYRFALLQSLILQWEPAGDASYWKSWVAIKKQQFGKELNTPINIIDNREDAEVLPEETYESLYQKIVATDFFKKVSAAETFLQQEAERKKQQEELIQKAKEEQEAKAKEQAALNKDFMDSLQDFEDELARLRSKYALKNVDDSLMQVVWDSGSSLLQELKANMQYNNEDREIVKSVLANNKMMLAEFENVLNYGPASEEGKESMLKLESYGNQNMNLANKRMAKQDDDIFWTKFWGWAGVIFLGLLVTASILALIAATHGGIAGIIAFAPTQAVTHIIKGAAVTHTIMSEAAFGGVMFGVFGLIGSVFAALWPIACFNEASRLKDAKENNPFKTKLSFFNNAVNKAAAQEKVEEKPTPLKALPVRQRVA